MEPIDYTPHLIHQTKKVKTLTERLSAFRAHLSSPFQKALKTGGVATGALIGGVIQGKAGPQGATIAHLPIDLLAGAALNVAAVCNVAGKEHSQHLGNVGDGLIAAYVTDVGFKIGKKWHEEGHLFGHGSPPSLPGAPTPGKVSGPLSGEQLTEIINRVHAAGQ